MTKNISAKRLALLIIGIIMLITPAFADTPDDSRPGDSSEPIKAEEFFEVLKNSNDLVAWRKRADNILKKYPHSYCGHCIMGYVLYNCEGNLPRAKYHLRECRKYAKKLARKNSQDAQLYYTLASFELINVLGDMDRYQEQINLINENSKPTPRLRVRKVWPLMKLDRVKEARKELDIAFSSGDDDARITAWNSLGALESELGNYQAAHTAFQSLLAELAKNKGENQPVYYNNAGGSAWALRSYDEAEQYYLKAASIPFKDYYISNPYRNLTELYRTEGRFAEAFDAAKKMHRWSRAIKPFLFQQAMAGDIERTSKLLLDLGYVDEAANFLSILVKRPDRTGATSSSVAELESNNLITWRYALIIQDHIFEEDMACSKTFSPSWWRLLYKRLSGNLDIKTAGEKAAAIMASNDLLKESLRSCNDYSPMLIDIFGTGICSAAIHEIEKSKPENLNLEAPFYQVMHAEIAMQKGNNKKELNLFDLNYNHKY